MNGRLKWERSCWLCWNNTPKTRLIELAAPLVIIFREAGGRVLLWDRPGCVPASDVVPRWLPSSVAWKWWEEKGGLRATLLSYYLSRLAHFQISCLCHVLWNFIPLSLLASLGTHMPFQGTKNFILRFLLEFLMPWLCSMVSCQCRLSSLLCPLCLLGLEGGRES